MAGANKKLKSTSDKPYTCSYCGQGFARETTLAVHNCELRRRYSQENELGVRLALGCFRRFYQHIQPAAKEKTYEDFVASPYYMAFVKFGRYLVEIQAIAPESFCDWLLRNNCKLDQWCRDKYYEQYLVDYLRKEAAAPALERTIETMNTWSVEKQARFQDYFKYASDSRICHDIQRGRISAWAIYASTSGTAWIGQLNQSDLAAIWDFVDSNYWLDNLTRREVDYAWATDLLQRAGI